MFTRWFLYGQIALLLIMVLGVALYRFEAVEFPFLAMTFGVSSLGLMGIAGISVLLLLLALLMGKRWDKVGLVGAVGVAALPVLSIVATVGPQGFKVPPIHDISTDLRQPPQFIAAAKLRKSSENTLVYQGETIAEQQRQAYPDILPKVVALPAEQVFSLSQQAVERLGWQILDSRAGSGELEAVESSAIFGFKDDVAIRVTTTEQGTVVDVRSVSRVGRSDLGANAQRIKRFYAELEKGL